MGGVFSEFATTISGTNSVSTTCATLPSLIGRTTIREKAIKPTATSGRGNNRLTIGFRLRAAVDREGLAPLLFIVVRGPQPANDLFDVSGA